MPPVTKIGEVVTRPFYESRQPIEGPATATASVFAKVQHILNTRRGPETGRHGTMDSRGTHAKSHAPGESIVAVVDQEGERVFFVAGGTISPDAESYVERQADLTLLTNLIAGKFCYVLNSRQMGKSSLCVRTMQKLRAVGVTTVFVDLTKIGGKNVSHEQWYAGIAQECGRATGLRREVLAYWGQNASLSPLQRLFGALREVVLNQLTGPVAIFFDEIDATRSLSFNTDEFFAAIRESYNRRVQDPVFSRLTFCLLGVAVPSDLINSPTSTPFNIGERIYLRDFTLAEALKLAEGLPDRALLERIYYWTNGHPFLTQSLCAAVLQHRIRTPSGVDDLVRRDLFDPKARETNINLADVANRALHAGDLEPDPEKFRADLLSAYRRSWSGKYLADDESNRVAALLKLSGIMRSEGNRLLVRNRIYRTVFGRAWIWQNMPGQELKRQRKAFWRGALRTGIVASAVIAVVSSAAVIATRSASLAKLAESKALIAEDQAKASLARAQSAEADARRSAQREREERLRAQRHAEGEAMARKQATQSADQAKRDESTARRLLYDSNMALTGEAAQRGSGIQMERLLASSGAPATRGWEFKHYLAVLNEAHELPPQPSGIRKLAFSPQGRLLVKTNSSEIQIWDLQSKAQVRPPSGIDYELRTNGDFDESGTKIVATRWDGGVEVLSPENLRMIKRFAGAGAPGLWTRVTADGRRLLYSIGGVVRYLDLRTGKTEPVRDFQTLEFPLYQLPDGKSLYLGGNGLECRQILGNAPPRVEWYAPGLEDSKLGVCAATKSGRIIAFSNSYGLVQLLDETDGHRLGPSLGQGAMVHAIAFSPDEQLVATGSDDGDIHVYRVTDGGLERSFMVRQTRISALAFDRSDVLAFGTVTGDLGYFHLSDFSAARGTLRVGSKYVESLAIDPAGSKIATAVQSSNEVEIWDPSSGRRESAFPVSSSNALVTFSPDGACLAVVADAGKTDGKSAIELVNLKSGRKRAIHTPFTGGFATPAFSSDGRTLFAGDGNKAYTDETPATVLAFDVATGSVTARGATEPGKVTSLLPTPDGRRLVVTRFNARSQILDAKSLRLIHVLEPDPSEPSTTEGWVSNRGSYAHSSCFTRDGRMLLIGRQDGRIDSYDAESGRRLGSLHAHTGRIFGMAFTKDGKTLLTIGDDRKLCFWSREGWKSVGEEDFPSVLCSLAMSPKDDTAFIGDERGFVYARRVKTGKTASNTQNAEVVKRQSLPNTGLESWDAVLADSHRTGKPILFAGSNQYGEYEGILRSMFKEPEISEILNRHFAIYFPWYNELTVYHRRKMPVISLLHQLFGDVPGYPILRIFRADGILGWDGHGYSPVTKRQEEVGLPVEPWEIENFLRGIRSAGVTLSKNEEDTIRTRATAIVSGLVEMSPKALKQINYTQAASRLLEAGNAPGAYKVAEDLIRFAPASLDGYRLKGIAAAALGRWGEASAYLAQVGGSVRPSYHTYHMFLTIQAALLLDGDTAEMRRRMDVLMGYRSEVDKDLDAWKECVGFGLSAEASADPVATAKRIEREFGAQISDPSGVTLRAAFGLVLMRAGRFTEAERVIRAALNDPMILPSSRSEVELYRMGLAIIRARMGDPKGAAKEFDRAEKSAGPTATDGKLVSAMTQPYVKYPESSAVYAVLRREAKGLLGR